MLTEPTAAPTTIPLADPTVAIPMEPEVHVPLPDGSLNVIAVPEQIAAIPNIGAGIGLTETVATLIQPVFNV